MLRGSDKTSASTTSSSLPVILSFLPKEERIAASRIDQRWFDAGCNLAAWSDDSPLAVDADANRRSMHHWIVISPKFASCMIERSRDQVCCRILWSEEHRAFREMRPQHASHLILQGLESLCHQSLSSTDEMKDTHIRVENKRQFMMQQYFPTLVWMLYCGGLSPSMAVYQDHSEDAKDSDYDDDDADDNDQNSDHGLVTVWEHCFAMIVNPEVVSISEHIEVMSAILMAFHYFRVSQVNIDIILRHADVFDAPLIVFERGYLIDSSGCLREANQRHACLVRGLIRECEVTLEAVMDACSLYPMIFSSDRATQREAQRLEKVKEISHSHLTLLRRVLQQRYY